MPLIPHSHRNVLTGAELRHFPQGWVLAGAGATVLAPLPDLINCPTDLELHPVRQLSTGPAPAAGVTAMRRQFDANCVPSGFNCVFPEYWPAIFAVAREAGTCEN